MGKEQKWVSMLIGYDFEVKYKLGKQNSAADALSMRLHLSATSSATSTVQFFEWDGIEELLADEKLRKVMQELVIQLDVHPRYELKRETMLRRQVGSSKDLCKNSFGAKRIP